jgi:hypothetical protein
MKKRISVIAAILIFVFGARVVTESLEFLSTEAASSYSNIGRTFDSLLVVHPNNIRPEIDFTKPQHAPERQPQGEFFNLQQVTVSGTTSPSPEQPQTVTGKTIDPWSKN